MDPKAPETTLARTRVLAREIEALGADALLVTAMPNVRYLSGFTGSEAVLIVAKRTRLLVVDSRYVVQAGKQAPDFKVVQYSRRVEELAPLLKQRRIERLAFEPGGLTHARFLELKRGLKGVRLVRMNDAVSRLRQRKSAPEIKLIERAARIARRAWLDCLDRLEPGVREREFAARLEYRMRELDGGPAPFATIVASGVRGALPHGVASEKKIRKGELVTIDFGAVHQGYQSDQTVTVCVGQASRKQRRIYDAVRAAHDRALEAIRPGMTAREADGIARESIRASGFGAYFGHGLGHGVGLETHEAPILGPRSQARLEPGAVVTIEPGIYIPGFGGVRIEDMVVLEGAGARLLTRSGGDLLEL